MLKIIIRSMALLVIVAMPANADELSRFNELNKIKTQKLLADVNAALARDLDPRLAVELLRRAKSQLEDDASLPERQRQQLLLQVQNRLSLVVVEVRQQKDREENAAQQAAAKIKKEQERQEIERQAKKPAGSGQYDTAKQIIGGTNQQLDGYARTKFLRERGFNNALNEVLESAANIEERRITDRFIAISKARKPKMDPKEAAIIKALNSTLSVDYNPARFKEVMEDLMEKLAIAKLNVAIIIDENSLKDAMVEYDDPVTFKAKNVTVRTILKAVLGNKGLGYIVKEGTIQVLTAQRARETMIVRSYNVSDLIEPDQRYGLFARQMMFMNAQSLMNVIMNSSGDPAMWQQGGASITFFEPTRSLIIRAPAEIHYMMPQLGAR